MSRKIFCAFSTNSICPYILSLVQLNLKQILLWISYDWKFCWYKIWQSKLMCSFNDPILVRYNFPDSILQILKFDINIFKWRNKWIISCSIFHARQSHRLQFVFLALFIINHLHWRSIILTRHVERPFHYPPRFNFNVKVKLVFIIF